MAADKIKVSTSEMQTCISNYQQARSTLADAFSALDQAKSHIDICWDGPAKTVYMMRWNNINANLRRTDNVIEQSINGLNNIINTMDNAENTIGSTAASLDVGTTPPIF